MPLQLAQRLQNRNIFGTFLFIDAQTSIGYGLGNQGVVIRFPRASRTYLETTESNSVNIRGSFPEI